MQCSACARYVVCFPWAINSYTLGNTGVGVHAVRAIHVAYFYYIEYMHIIINIAFSSLPPLPPDSYSNLLSTSTGHEHLQLSSATSYFTNYSYHGYYNYNNSYSYMDNQHNT